MTSPSSSTDVLTLKFYNPINQQNVGGINLAGNGQPNQQGFALTECALEKDFFSPSNSFMLTISQIDSQLTGSQSITSWMQNGLACTILINGKIQMTGFVFQYQLHITKQGGTTLVLHIKDLLELMAQGTVFPNLGDTTRGTNVHFGNTITLAKALFGIASSFVLVNNLQSLGDIVIKADDSKNKSIAAGFGVGLPSKGKTPKSRQNSLSKNLNHLTTPNKGESYLAYMLRLAKHAGANLRMADDQPNTITCKPPSYDRDPPSPFQLTHLLSVPVNSTIINNVESASYYFDNNSQYSCAIIEANTTASNGAFYQQTFKGIAINEINAYPSNLTSAPSNSVAQINATLSGLGNAINSLTNIQTANNTTGFSIAPFNQQLYQAGQSLPIKNMGLQLPYYSVDNNAHSGGSGSETDYAASKVLSEAQDRYCTFVYTVTGWSDNQQHIWQPDMLCNITEETFNPGNPQNITMWIRKVKFTKSRGQGTRTEITLSLPYTHQFSMDS